MKLKLIDTCHISEGKIQDENKVFNKKIKTTDKFSVYIPEKNEFLDEVLSKDIKDSYILIINNVHYKIIEIQWV